MHLLNNPEFSLECEHFSLGSIKVSLKWGDNLRGWVIKWRVRRFQDFKGGFLKSGVLKKEKILPQCDNVLNRVRLAFKSIAKSKLTIFYWPRVLTVKLIRNLSILCKIDEFNILLCFKVNAESLPWWDLRKCHKSKWTNLCLRRIQFGGDLLNLSLQFRLLAKPCLLSSSQFVYSLHKTFWQPLLCLQFIFESDLTKTLHQTFTYYLQPKNIACTYENCRYAKNR